MKTRTADLKPLKRRCYGSIGHLPGSRMDINHQKHETGKVSGQDFGVPEGQSKICQEKARPGDRVVITEKLDGSNVAIAMVDGRLEALNRAGYRCDDTCPWEFLRAFEDWVRVNAKRFRKLPDRWRISGEWMGLAHGTMYDWEGDPFVPFDIFTDGNKRLPRHDVEILCGQLKINPVIALGHGGPMPHERAVDLFQTLNYYHAKDPIEGVVYRVENGGNVEFLAKYVRPEKVDGAYLDSVCGSNTFLWTPDVLDATTPGPAPAEGEDKS